MNGIEVLWWCSRKLNQLTQLQKLYRSATLWTMFFAGFSIFSAKLNALKVHAWVWYNFFTTESPLKMMKNAFYFMLKALFVLKIFTFLAWLFGHVGKRLDKKAKVNFKIYDVINRDANNYNNTDIAWYLKKWMQSVNEMFLVNRISHDNNSFWKMIHKRWWRNYSQTFF